MNNFQLCISETSAPTQVRQRYHEAQRYAMEKATNTFRTTRLWDFDRHSGQSRKQLPHDRYSRCTRADARLRGVCGSRFGSTRPRARGRARRGALRSNRLRGADRVSSQPDADRLQWVSSHRSVDAEPSQRYPLSVAGVLSQRGRERRLSLEFVRARATHHALTRNFFKRY